MPKKQKRVRLGSSPRIHQNEVGTLLRLANDQMLQALRSGLSCAVEFGLVSRAARATAQAEQELKHVKRAEIPQSYKDSIANAAAMQVSFARRCIR